MQITIWLPVALCLHFWQTGIDSIYFETFCILYQRHNTGQGDVIRCSCTYSMSGQYGLFFYLHEVPIFICIYCMYLYMFSSAEQDISSVYLSWPIRRSDTSPLDTSCAVKTDPICRRCVLLFVGRVGLITPATGVHNTNLICLV